jgi:hypothetical protein
VVTSGDPSAYSASAFGEEQDNNRRLIVSNNPAEADQKPVFIIVCAMVDEKLTESGS